MGKRLTGRIRPGLVFSVFCLIVYILFARNERISLLDAEFTPSNHDASHPRRIDYDNLFLDEAECARTFPGLAKEVDNFVSQGPFDLPFRPGVVLQGKIENNNLIVIRAPRKGELSSTMRHRQSAILQQLHRALLTSPSPLPNTSFAFAVHDQPASNSLSFARPVISASHKRILPMPHFSFWSWPLPFINSLPSAARAITAIEDTTPWQSKDARAVWRGTTWFNNGAGSHPRLRQDLVATVPKEASWADIEPLEWDNNAHDAKNALRIEDFCRYKYIVHTEGIGYSGRFQFHQLCASVILSPALEWMQHTTHLARPVFSSTLLNRESHASARVKKAWPVDYTPEEANMVFVAPDWSDLEDTVRWLEGHEDVAEGIAKRQRAVYADEGYLSPAAEVCYWRAAIKGWGETARPTGQGWEGTGLPFEEFITGKENGKE